MGALVTPLPVGAPAPPVLPRQPTSCRQCGAYVNCYCEVGSWSSIATGYPAALTLRQPLKRCARAPSPARFGSLE